MPTATLPLSNIVNGARAEVVMLNGSAFKKINSWSLHIENVEEHQIDRGRKQKDKR